VGREERMKPMMGTIRIHEPEERRQKDRDEHTQATTREEG